MQEHHGRATRTGTALDHEGEPFEWALNNFSRHFCTSRCTGETCDGVKPGIGFGHQWCV